MNNCVAQAKENASKILISYIKDINDPPNNHESLVSYLREKAKSNELWLLGALEDHMGHSEFREWVSEILIDSGLYKRNNRGMVIPVTR